MGMEASMGLVFSAYIGRLVRGSLVCTRYHLLATFRSIYGRNITVRYEHVALEICTYTGVDYFLLTYHTAPQNGDVQQRTNQ